MTTASPKKDAGPMDPVLAAIEAAPVVPFSPDEEAAFEEGMAAIRAGHVCTPEEVRAAIMQRSEE
jgi:predicted transcriptional regulator